jgi:hypothetical protein
VSDNRGLLYLSNDTGHCAQLHRSLGITRDNVLAMEIAVHNRSYALDVASDPRGQPKKGQVGAAFAPRPGADSEAVPFLDRQPQPLDLCRTNREAENADFLFVKQRFEYMSAG